MIDFAKQIENLGTDMTDAERQLAIINGIQNNLGVLIDWVQRIDLRLQTLEDKLSKSEDS